MFDSILTQLRALLAQLSGTEQQQNSLPDLNVSLRNAARSVRAAQAALARAKAEQIQDRKHLHELNTSIAELEKRACSALAKGLEALAREAAEAIAVLEDERMSLERAIETFDEELSNLTVSLHRAQARLRNLKRGERTAEVVEKIQRAQSLGSSADQSALSKAEEQLETISRSQERNRLADREFIALSASGPDCVIEKLAEAGCGAPLHTRADDILNRLRSNAPLLLEKPN